MHALWPGVYDDRAFSFFYFLEPADSPGDRLLY